MISAKKLLYKLIEAFNVVKNKTGETADDVTGLQTDVASIKSELEFESGTIPSSAWTASNASYLNFTYFKYGRVWLGEITLKATSAMSAGSEYMLGTVDPSAFPMSTRNVGIQVSGTVTFQSSGIVRTVPSRNISSGANLYVKLISIKYED